MNLIIKRETAEAMGFEKFVEFGVSVKSWETWREKYDALDLADLELDQVKKLRDLFKKLKPPGWTSLEWDCTNWIGLKEKGADKRRARTVRQFETMLAHYFLEVEGHRIYQRQDTVTGAMLAYYVGEVDYNPPYTHRDGTREPANVTMKLHYESIGGHKSSTVIFHAEDCVEKPVVDSLLEMGYLAETPELRKAYLESIALYSAIVPKIGKQYLAKGSGELKSRSSSDWGYFRNTEVKLENDKVIIDLFVEPGEDEDEDRGGHSYGVDTHFWKGVDKTSDYDPETDTLTARGIAKLQPKPKDENDEDETGEEKLNRREQERYEREELRDLEDADSKRPRLEIPIHPWVIIFHLAKHERFRVHVDQLTEYIFDKKIADKLVLPEDTKNLVKILIDSGGGIFQDIIEDKGGGAVVLLTGPPGTGKTLTAEVFAESEERALYSVQCSQLGLKPEALEEELLEVFERAERWNAVILLDEADVYIHERGDSLAQNAIVGVFLRLLEYQSTVLFMTSNRPQDVDDAVASRCIARLHYGAPSPDDAKKIWKILSAVANIKVSATTIIEVVKNNPDMTGRDVKNILKLCSLMSKNGSAVTAKDIEFVKRFKPTGNVVEVKA